ncbi:hypothetical protein CYMTET_43754 [Cymbomonas tetramitiformis]|uniref:Uncharacterized protein n=1 Tax=Cymbomonas tetramitiformis TaxID=36881 RepID=A0AAE0F0C0_9CHLO|nr:hypothetical protein CYMTET_43754 [Cymbomonas tetramitiformis]
MLKRNRHLETDIKVALTGQSDGVCREELVESTEEAKESEVESVLAKGTGEDDDSDSDSSVDLSHSDDEDLVQAGEDACKDYTLQHRCLGTDDWRSNNVLESLLEHPYKKSLELQAHEGVGLDKEHLLMLTLYGILVAKHVEIVKGANEDETYETVASASLAREMRDFRSLTAQEVKERFLTPDSHTLLALRMNPTIDTSASGELMRNKKGRYEMMEGEYNRRLNARHEYLIPKVAAAGRSGEVGQDSAAPAQASSEKDSMPGKKRRKTMIELSSKWKMSSAAVDMQEDDPVLESAIEREKSLFAEISRRRDLETKYVHARTKTKPAGEFDLCAFWTDHEQVLPIHTAVFRGDVWL